ncbi:MAG TPA: hypothetical protein VGG19_04770 [Tepidisphaeraceae bacterium]
MLKWMSNNGKYLMAVFGVLLMMVYILPNATKYGGNSNDPVRGHMGKVAIHQTVLTQYSSEWKYLNTYAIVQEEVPNGPDGLPEKTWVPIGYRLGPAAFQQVRQHPDMYALLVEEAQQMGAGVSEDQLNGFMQNELKTVDEGSNKVISPAESQDPDREANLRACVRNFLIVENAFQQVATTIKPSLPIAQYMLATQRQTISADVVEFSDAADLAKVPAPTPEQMQKQFQEYANIDATVANLRTDPFDFGYKYPNRIKLQYLSVPRSAIAGQALRARNQNDQTRYDWDIAAYRYYQAHQSAYATTQPSGELSLTQSTEKKIRPFKEVNDEVRQSVLSDDTDKLTSVIRQRIISEMGADFLAWKNATSTGTATPVSGVGVPYNSLEYMDRLALMIQQSYGVLPTAVTVGDWQTAVTLDSLNGISMATVDDPDMPPTAFARYVVSASSTFASSTPDQDESHSLGIYEPSLPLKEEESDFYIFRITDAQLSHQPASIAEVAQQVQNDVKTKNAYEMAETRANQYLSAAKAVHSVSTPSRPAGQPVIHAGPMQFSQMDPIIGYAITSPLAQRQFIEGSFDLLSSATPSNPEPIGLIANPMQGKAIVAQITHVDPLWASTATVPMMEAATAQSIRREFLAALQEKWFNYDNLVARTDYHEQKSAEPSSPSVPNNSQPNPPLL